MGRRLLARLASVAALAAAFAAGWLVGRAPGAGPAASPGGDPDATSPVAPPAVERGLAAVPHDTQPAPPPPDGAPAVAAGPAPASGSPPRGPPTAATVLPAAYGSIEVRVLHADGYPAPRARVRVRRSGVAATEGGRPIGPLDVDGDGRVAFAVLGAGPFDVEARGDRLEAVRAAGVRVAADRPTEVVLRLPRMTDVAFRAEGLPTGASWQLMLRAPLDGPAAPADDDEPSWQGAGNGPILRATVPADGAVVASGWASLPPSGARCEPFVVVVAPEVAVPFVPRTPAAPGSTTRLTLVLVPEATEGALPPRGSAVVDVVLAVDGSLHKDRSWTIAWQPGDAEDRHATSVEVLSGGRGRYRWQARGGPADEVTLPELPPGGSVVVRGRLRLPPASVVVGYGDVVVEDARGAPWVPTEEAGVRVFTGTECVGAAHGADELGALARGLRTPTLTLATDAWHVSRPVPAAPGGTTRVRVELGGYLVVHVPVPPPSGAGVLALRRTDGGWLGLRESPLPAPGAPGAPEESAVEAVHNGAVLGPLAAGPVGLEVSLGGAPLGVVTATVVAGEVAVLTLR